MSDDRQSIEIDVHPSWPEFEVRGSDPAIGQVMDDVGGPPPVGGAVTYSYAVGAGKPFAAMNKRIEQIKAAAEARGAAVTERR